MPASCENIQGFVETFFSICSQFAADWKYSKGKATLTKGYIIKNYLRQWLALIEKLLGEEALDSTTVGDVNAWVPDQNEHTAPLSKWSGNQVKETFNMSILRLSMWTRFAGWASAEGRAQLIKRPQDAFKMHQRLLEKHRYATLMW